MGHTNYFNHKGFTDEQWNKLVTFTKKLISDTKIPIVGAAGDEGTFPVINGRYISFNGEGDDSCETFYLSRGQQDSEFCKTRQRPYDAIVVAIMRSAAEINPSFTPSSDLCSFKCPFCGDKVEVTTEAASDGWTKVHGYCGGEADKICGVGFDFGDFFTGCTEHEMDKSVMATVGIFGNRRETDDDVDASGLHLVT